MAKTKFGIGDIIAIKGQETERTGMDSYQEIWLNPREVKPSKSNFYSQEGIEELADSFLTVGQQQPTVLARIDGEYRIVSGHRRNLANIKNLERGYKECEKVRYLYKEMTPAMLELSLLMGNACNRELTAWEKTQQAQRLKEVLLRAKKEDGLEIKGKLRDIIADMMHESSSNIAKMNSIQKNATAEIQEEFKKGTLGISAAYEASKLPLKEQKDIAEKTAKGKNIPIKEIVGKASEKKIEQKKVFDSNTLPETESGQKVIGIGDRKQKKNEKSKAETNLTEAERTVSKMDNRKGMEQHRERLARWKERDADIIRKVFDSNSLEMEWTDTDWVAFMAKAITEQAEDVSKEDLYLLHGIMIRCQRSVRFEHFSTDKY